MHEPNEKAAEWCKKNIPEKNAIIISQSAFNKLKEVEISLWLFHKINLIFFEDILRDWKGTNIGKQYSVKRVPI